MEDTDKKDIFSGDSRFPQEEKPKVEEKSFKAGFSNLGEGIFHILKGFWHIFSKKFHMNVLVLLLIIALIGAAFYFMDFEPRTTPQNETVQETTSVGLSFPSGVDTSLIDIENIQSVITNNCITEGQEKQINLNCPTEECPLCKDSSTECPECICETTTEQTIYYQCLNGILKENKSECNRLPLGLKTEDFIINNSILLALNNIEFELFEEGKFDGVIKLINVSIYNAAGYDIKPKLKIYLYETWNADEQFKKVITFDERIVHSDQDSNEGITWTESSNTNFLKKQRTMKLELFDLAEDENEVIARLVARLDYS